MSDITNAVTNKEPALTVSIGAAIALYAMQWLTGHAVVTPDQAKQLGQPLADAINNLWPLIVVIGGLLTRARVSSPATVGQIITDLSGAAVAPPPVTATTPSPTVPVPVSPAAPVVPPTPKAVSRITIVDSKPLNANITIEAGTARYSVEDGSRIDVGGPNGDGYVGPAILHVTSLDNLLGSIHGHFYRTSTEPRYYVSEWLATDIVDTTPPAPVIAPPTPSTPPASVAKTAFVRTFGDIPGHIWDVTLGKIQAAGLYRQNADGSWSAKTIQEWRRLAQQFGATAAVAAFDVMNGLPKKVQAWNGSPADLYPADMQANVDQYFTGVVGTSGSALHPGVMEYFAFRDGQLLGQMDGSGTTDTAAFGASLGLDPLVGWYD